MAHLIQKHKGAYNELRAVCWLLDQGFEVYRNISQHGLVDVIAIKGDKTLLLDIKGRRSIDSIGSSRTAEQQVAAGVKWLIVTDDDFRLIDPITRAAPRPCAKCGVMFRPKSDKRRINLCRPCRAPTAYARWRAKQLERLSVPQRVSLGED